MAPIAAASNRALHRALDFVLRIDRNAAIEPADGSAPSLREFNPASLATHEEKTAFWINAYNDLVQDAVAAFRIESSVREDTGFFRRAARIVGGLRYSADDIEHGILRGNRRHPFPIIPPQFAPGDPRLVHTIEPMDPRIHFALNCASRSCPRISVYDASSLDRQLDVATTAFINGGAVELSGDGRRVLLSRIFRWYQRDFGGRKHAVAFVLRYLDDPVLAGLLAAQGTPIGYQPYDWSLTAPGH